MQIVALLVGALVGGILGHDFGVLSGALLGWLAWRSLQQQREIAELRGRLTPPVVPAAPRASEPAPAPPPEPRPVEAPSAKPVLPQPPAPLPVRPAPVARPDPLAPIKAWLFGGNTIVKAGVGILFVGLAFLAKYATEHVSVPVEWRLAGIGAIALALLVVGWRLRARRAGYAQVLQGGAVAVLYLTLFAAFRLYGVMAVGPVFGLMVGVAALAAALAVLQDARALAVVGAVGGFATPLLLSDGSGQALALFSYYLVLDLGIAAVAWRKTWRALNGVGFAGTFLVATAWGVLKYRPADYAMGQTFLVLYFLLFVAILLLPARRPAAGPGDRWVNGALLFGLPTITFVLQHGLVRDTPYGTAISALVLAAFYVGLARLMRSRPALALGFEASLGIAIVFLTLVIPFALDARSTAGAWALEGAGLVWLGLRQQRGLARIFGYALQFLAGVAMLWAHEQHGAPQGFVNAYAINALLAVAAAWGAALFVQRARDLRASERWAEPLLIGWGLLWALFVVALQVDRFVDARFAPAAWLLGLSAIALACTGLSTRLDWPRIAAPALGHAPLLALIVLDSALEWREPVADGGWWAWPLALATHGIVLWQAARRWPPLAQNVVHVTGVAVLAGLGALQGRALTQTWGDAGSAWVWLGWLVLPALLALLLQHDAAARRWPIRMAPAAYRTGAGAMLSLGLLLWVLLANAASDGSALPLPYLPLLNPLDLAVAVALFAVARWQQGEAARPVLAALPWPPLATLGAVGFVWLNAMLIRGFHHYGGVPFHVGAWLHSLAVQSGLALLWSATALVLMWLSARRAARAPWMVGAALLAAVVLKLLLVDLSGSGTVTRIVSFIGVGLLMLVIGYVAPLPGRTSAAGAARG